MKRSLIKQLVISAFFACSLSADVPDVREQALGGGQLALRSPGEAGTTGYRGRSIRQTGACSFVLCDGHAIGQPARPAAKLDGTDSVVYALSSLWTQGDFGVHPMDPDCIRLAVFSGGRSEAMNVPADPCDAAFVIPRYRIPLALQESVWARPVGYLEPALAPDIAGRSGRADMEAMIPRLKKVFVKEGVPQQWVWVAEVESTLNPRAVSSAGAAGLFQLMPGTARRFGLRTEPVDDRMAPEKSAGAAAQYLKFLRQEFGCWSLALAAYNAGEGRVKEIMKKRKALTFNEVERYLPAETRAYVPKVMAIVALREDQLHNIPGSYWMP